MQKALFLFIIIVVASCSPRFEKTYIYHTPGSFLYYNSGFYEYATGSGCIWSGCRGKCIRRGDTLYFTPKPMEMPERVKMDTLGLEIRPIDFCPEKGIGIVNGDTLYAFGRKYIYLRKTRKTDISYK